MNHTHNRRSLASPALGGVALDCRYEMGSFDTKNAIAQETPIG